MKPIRIRVTESTVAGGRRVEEKQVLSAPADIPVHDAHALISLGKAVEVLEMPEDPTDAPSAGQREGQQASESGPAEAGN